jgi:predicted RNA polymerase sigma factor
MRPALCEEALRLGRILAELTPEESEVHGLVAMMEIQASRLRARTRPSGEPILLLEQNRALWDPLLIGRGLAALERAEHVGPLGPYGIQASIAACHARARTAEQTDWSRIVQLYDALQRIAPSPIVALNQAVAVSMASGPEAGLAIVDDLAHEPALAGYHLLPSVRAISSPSSAAEMRRVSRSSTPPRSPAIQRERALLLGRAAALDRGRQTP